jgi:hypothetical protein
VTQENNRESNTCLTQSGERVSQGLHGVRERARSNKQERFTALLHHVTIELLRESFYALKRKAAPGVDGVTWKEYAIGLEDRLTDYRLKPVESFATESRFAAEAAWKGSRLRAGLRRGGRGNFETLIVFVPPLILNVLFDRLLVHRAHARAEVAPRPQVLAPVFPPQLRELLLQFSG